MDTVFLITIALFVFLLSGLLVYFQNRIRKQKALNIKIAGELSHSESNRAQLAQQLNAVIHLTHDFTEASDEDHIIESLLTVSMELTGANGSSFVPLDIHGKPMAAVKKGESPFPIPDAWLEYLADPGVRNACQACVTREAHVKNCPLIHGPFSDAMGLNCLPLRYGERDLGLLNIYLPGPANLDPEMYELLNSITQATALALESNRLRNREILTISQLGQIRQKSDIDTTLVDVLENLHEAMNAEISILLLDEKNASTLDEQIKSRQAFIIGNFPQFHQIELPGFLEKFVGVDGVANGSVLYSGFHWLGIPINFKNQQKPGWLLLAGNTQDQFSQRRIVLAQSVAENISMLVYNTELLAEIQFKILMEERARLAREIHDGLAQTLGFLKLQLAQMFGYLDRDDLPRLRETMRTCYNALSEAYDDTRLAIDGLRTSPSTENGLNLKSWLTQTVEYYAGYAFKIHLSCEMIALDLPLEMHAQLIRIVQEALSNIRKHAQAETVWIECSVTDHDLIIEIKDDGIGFTPENIPSPSRYGLRGMKERTELLGADFQIVSRSGEGTTIRVRIPLEEQNWMEV